jgi:hypothetical protein
MAARRTLRKQHVVQRADDQTNERSSYRLLHAHCHRRLHAGGQHSPAINLRNPRHP